MAKLGIHEYYGSGCDGNLSVLSSNFDLNVDFSGDRIYADGIAYKVTTNPTTASINVGETPNGFASSDRALLINLQGTSGDNADVGNYEILYVTGTDGDNITLENAPSKSYDGGNFSNQVVVIQRIPQYRNIAVGADASITASAWDGTGRKTGIVAFYAYENLNLQTSTSLIDASKRGFRGGVTNTSGPEYWGGRWTSNGDAGNSGNARRSATYGGHGGVGGGGLIGGAGGAGGGPCNCDDPGDPGSAGNTSSFMATGGGGGGGGPYAQGDPGTGDGGDGGQGYIGGGGGGGRGDNTSGATGGCGGGGAPYYYTITEAIKALDDFTKISLGGGAPAGAGAGTQPADLGVGSGGSILGGYSGEHGGGIVMIKAYNLTAPNSQSIRADGGLGGDGESGSGGGGGGAHGASGGSVFVSAKNITVVSGSITARGGSGGDGGNVGGQGGDWASGFDKGLPGEGGIGGSRWGSGGGGAGGNAGYSGKAYLRYKTINSSNYVDGSESNSYCLPNPSDTEALVPPSAFRIGGSTNTVASMLVINESDWSVDHCPFENSAGDYKTATSSGIKIIAARRTEDGEFIGYGRVNPDYEEW